MQRAIARAPIELAMCGPNRDAKTFASVLAARRQPFAHSPPSSDSDARALDPRLYETPRRSRRSRKSGTARAQARFAGALEVAESSSDTAEDADPTSRAKRRSAKHDRAGSWHRTSRASRRRRIPRRGGGRRCGRGSPERAAKARFDAALIAAAAAVEDGDDAEAAIAALRKAESAWRRAQAPNHGKRGKRRLRKQQQRSTNALMSDSDDGESDGSSTGSSSIDSDYSSGSCSGDSDGSADGRGKRKRDDTRLAGESNCDALLDASSKVAQYLDRSATLHRQQSGRLKADSSEKSWKRHYLIPFPSSAWSFGHDAFPNLELSADPDRCRVLRQDIRNFVLDHHRALRFGSGTLSRTFEHAFARFDDAVHQWATQRERADIKRWTEGDHARVRVGHVLALTCFIHLRVISPSMQPQDPGFASWARGVRITSVVQGLMDVLMPTAALLMRKYRILGHHLLPRYQLPIAFAAKPWGDGNDGMLVAGRDDAITSAWLARALATAASQTTGTKAAPQRTSMRFGRTNSSGSNTTGRNGQKKPDRPANGCFKCGAKGPDFHGFRQCPGSYTSEGAAMRAAWRHLMPAAVAAAEPGKSSGRPS